MAYSPLVSATITVDSGGPQARSQRRVHLGRGDRAGVQDSEVGRDLAGLLGQDPADALADEFGL